MDPQFHSGTLDGQAPSLERMMAADWIKMRADLFTHPKVVRMMSVLKADKFRTVGGLMSVWCLFDAHSVDGHLSGYTSKALDSVIGWSGFSEAMKAVEWLSESEDGGLFLPRFDSHNGQSAKRRAQDTDRKRSVRILSASEADKKRTREEKRREVKKEGSSIPEWVPADAWNGFLAMRTKIKKPLTDRAVVRMLSRLSQFRDKGLNIGELLDEATAHCWQDIYEPKAAPTNGVEVPWKGAL